MSARTDCKVGFLSSATNESQYFARVEDEGWTEGNVTFSLENWLGEGAPQFGQTILLMALFPTKKGWRAGSAKTAPLLSPKQRRYIEVYPDQLNDRGRCPLCKSIGHILDDCPETPQG